MFEIKKSPVHGKGVFAKAKLVVGTTFINHILPITAEFVEESFGNYTFPFYGKKFICICLGEASLINHNDVPNVTVKSIDRVNLTKEFQVISEINEGDELFLDYGYQP